MEGDTGSAADAVIIAINGAFRRASGYTDAEMIGRRVADLFPSGQAETVMRAVRDGSSLRTELACGRARGGSFMFGFHLMPAPERSPGRVCFTILGRDITAQFEARRLQDSIQRLLAKVFASVDEAVAIVNVGGRIVMTNPRTDRLLGYKPNELVGRPTLDVVANTSRAAVAEAVGRQLRTGQDQSYIATLLKADGSQVAVNITSVLVVTDDAKKFRIITMRAITSGTRAACCVLKAPAGSNLSAWTKSVPRWEIAGRQWPSERWPPRKRSSSGAAPAKIAFRALTTPAFSSASAV